MKPPAATSKPPRVQLALEAAAQRLDVTVPEMLSTWQTPKAVKARALAAPQLRAMGFSLPQIGRFLGGRHHTTVHHLLRKYHPTSAIVPAGVKPPFIAGDTPDESGLWAI